MTTLPFELERTIVIAARRTTVFRYFTDSARFAEWWGEGSRIEGRPGGALLIRYPNGATASGEVIELVPDERVVFSYGYDDPGKPIPPGGSRVTITLADDPAGTRLSLRHEVKDAATRDMHVAGWRFQLAVFANVTAREEQAQAPERIDRFFSLWSETDPPARAAGLAELTTEDVSFRDPYGCVSGRAELGDHLAAVQLHMAGSRLKRTGEVRQCQGTALADWTSTGPDGKSRGAGTNVFELAGDGRIRRVVGLGRLA
jgi:uncharacterized protein YndB with AHSA1/START domain